MKLQDIAIVLPESWAMQQIGNAHKRHMGVLRKRAQLDPYRIGLMRLNDMNIKPERMSELSIKEIGHASISHKPIMVIFVRADWVVLPYSYQSFREFRGNGFVIRGKHVHKFNHHDHKSGTLEELMRKYEERDTQISSLDANGLFHSFQGKRTHKGKKACGMGVSAQSVQYKAEQHSRPWKHGERVHMRAKNRKKREANIREQMALDIIHVSKVGLVCKTKSIKY